MPSHLQRRVVKLGFEAILEVKDESAEGGVGDELIVGVVLLLIAALAIDIVPLRLIENHPSEVAETGPSEMLMDLLHEWAML